MRFFVSERIFGGKTVESTQQPVQNQVKYEILFGGIVHSKSMLWWRVQKDIRCIT